MVLFSARYGIQDYGPIGFDNPASARIIKVGFVGTPGTIRGVADWMIAAKAGVAERPSKKPRFRPRFPGFGPQSPFRCDWATEPRLQRPIEQRQINSVLTTSSRNDAVKAAVKLFAEECRYLNEAAKVDVVVCAPPIELLRHFANEVEGEEEEEAQPKRKPPSKSRKQKQRAALNEIGVALGVKS